MKQLKEILNRLWGDTLEPGGVCPNSVESCGGSLIMDEAGVRGYHQPFLLPGRQQQGVSHSGGTGAVGALVSIFWDSLLVSGSFGSVNLTSEPPGMAGRRALEPGGARSGAECPKMSGLARRGGSSVSSVRCSAGSTLTLGRERDSSYPCSREDGFPVGDTVVMPKSWHTPAKVS